MNKPLTMIIKEVRAKLIDVCNESGLPLTILDLIIQNIYSEIHMLAEKQAISEEKSYIETMKNTESENADKK